MPSPLPYHRALSRRLAAGRPLTLEEVRSRMETPPAEPVRWVARTIGVPRRERFVYAQLFSEARLLGAASLGLNTDEIVVKRADEPEISEVQEPELSGSRSA
jgi:hypothetical protein